jgi:transcriptional regulator with XRE-family HTH domain
MQIHLKIKELIVNKGLTVTAFASDLGISRTTAHNYLNGKIGIDLYTLLSICEKYETPLSYFIVDKEKSDLLEENQRLKQHITKIETMFKAKLLEKWLKDGKGEPPSEMHEFQEYKDLETMFYVFTDPEVKKAFDQYLEPRITPLMDVGKKRKDK